MFSNSVTFSWANIPQLFILLPKGSVDENGQPHGRGTLYFQSGDRFEGKFKHGNKHGKGCFYFEDGSILQGGFVDDAISGTGVYTFPDGSYMVGSYTDGDLNGLVEEFYANGKRQSKAFYTNNTRTGVVYNFDEYGSCLFGKVNNEGQLSGDDIAYVYPDKETSLKGRFKVYNIIHGRYHVIVAKPKLYIRYSKQTKFKDKKFEHANSGLVLYGGEICNI